MTKIIIDIPEPAYRELRRQWTEMTFESEDSGAGKTSFEECVKHYICWGLDAGDYQDKVQARLVELKEMIDAAMDQISRLDVYDSNDATMFGLLFGGEEE